MMRKATGYRPQATGQRADAILFRPVAGRPLPVAQIEECEK
jgi:hypothetical protein